jgi:hypothetical protein
MSRRSELEGELVEKVAQRYLDSGDFNGVSLAALLKGRGSKALDAVRNLVQQNILEIVAENWDFPYIKRMAARDTSAQLDVLQPDNASTICVYPTVKCMSRALPRSYAGNRPFTRLLALGHPQLEPMFFELGVLHRYRADPRYMFDFKDLAGHISITDKHYRSREMSGADKALVSNFGLGTCPRGGRVVVVFLRYLSPLTSRHQQHWASHRMRGKCKVESNYYRRCVYGEWTKGISVYAAIVQEFLQINKMCALIGLPQLFKRDFVDEPPKGFGLLMKTTREEYLGFAHTLDKLISENLNPDFFAAQGISLIDHEKNERKGSLRLLQDWLTRKIRIEDANGIATIMKPLRRVRGERQPRAHAVLRDDFSPKYQTMKEELIGEAYTSIANIRRFFQTHPAAQSYQFPDALDPHNIVSY